MPLQSKNIKSETLELNLEIIKYENELAMIRNSSSSSRGLDEGLENIVVTKQRYYHGTIR